MVADDFINVLIGKVNEKITLFETLKKMNDYHANFCVERTVMIAELKMAMKDDRVDDCYLVTDEEPVSTGVY